MDLPRLVAGGVFCACAPVRVESANTNTAANRNFMVVLLQGKVAGRLAPLARDGCLNNP